MSTGTDERDHSETDGSRRTSAADREAARVAQVVTRRAIKRLDILEWVILFAGVGLAMLGGAVVAWIFAGMAGWDFRTTWIGASIVLFVVPGAVAVIKIRREERRDALRQAETLNEEEEDDG